MSKYLSDQNSLSFTYESGTYGAVSGTQQWIGLCQESSIDESMNVIPVRYQGSTDRNVDTFADGNKEYTGTFTYFPQDWKFLGIAIGSVSETATAGSHVFTETNNDDQIYNVAGQSLSPFTLTDAKNNGTAGSNIIRTMNGCMIDSYAVTWSQGEVVSCEVGYNAQDMALTSGAVTAVTPSTTKPYMFSDFSLQIPSGTTYDNATEVTFTVNNNLEAGFYLNGSRTAKEQLPMNRDYEVTATLWMDSSNAQTLYDSYFTAGSTFNGQLSCIGAAGSVFVTMSGCKMTEMEIPSPLEGVSEQSVTFVPQHVTAIAEDATADYNAW